MASCLSNRAESSKSGKAFTLIELLVVVAITALLLAILSPALRKVQSMAKRVYCQANLKQITLAWHVYLNDNEDFFYQLNNANHEFGGWEGTGGYGLSRLLNPYLDLPLEIKTEDVLDIEKGDIAKVFRCPTDKGGVYPQPAYDWYGNSYQTNLMLVGPGLLETEVYPEPWRTLHEEINKLLPDLKRTSVSEPARVVLVGDNNWIAQWQWDKPYGKHWHDKEHHYSVAFLDGHTGFVHIRKWLYVADEYRVLPFRDLYRLARKLQEEVVPEDEGEPEE
jgi:prepilin-type N-terminal cleavage/methylation domain-containing protein